MRNLIKVCVAILPLISEAAHADTTANDKVFANAALRELHNLAVGSAQYEQAAADSDNLGCRDANMSMQKAAHEAFKDMHNMSFEPIDAIQSVSTLVRLGHLTSPSGCPDESVVIKHLLSTIAGQAIILLRMDYAVGDDDWYTANARNDIEAENPLRYAQSLKDQHYSWVSVRPKDMIFMIVSDWKSEMASYLVDDPSIQSSGKNLKAVEVDYRKNPDDDNIKAYFYRTKEDAMAAVEPIRRQRETNLWWSQKFTSLPYIIANYDVGFKLVYGVCRPGKNAKGENACKEESSHDWSDNQGLPYHWFGDLQGCEKAQLSISGKYPSDVVVGKDDLFDSSCIPASKWSGIVLKGYKMVLALSAPGADYDDNVYADLRDSASRTTAVFKTFEACYSAINDTYGKLIADLGTDEDGRLLSDKTKSISLMATCVRVY